MALKSSLVWLLAIQQLCHFMYVAAESRDLDEGVAAFAKVLLKHFNGVDEKENIVISPYAIQRQLLLVLQGTHGTTYDEVQQAIQLDGVDEATYLDVFAKRPTEFICKDHIFKQQKTKFRMPYSLLAKILFEVHPEDIDFSKPAEAAAEINQKMELETGAKIRKVIKEKDLAATDNLAYLNGALFSAAFADPFQKRSTTLVKFHSLGNHDKTFNMQAMYGVKYVPFAKLNDIRADAISLPYLNSEDRLLIILPRQVDDLKGVVERVAKTDFSLLIRRLKRELVSITIPHVDISYRVLLKNVLPKLNSSELFAANADLDNAFDKPVPENQVPVIITKAHFEINEHGTSLDEQTAKGKAQIPKDTETPQQFFVVKHPFLFFIHNNDTIHFFGRFINSVPTIDPDDIQPTLPSRITDDDD